MPPSRSRGHRRGLRCPDCGNDKLRVVYTRSREHGVVQRRRECRGCLCRVTTWEQILPRDVYRCNDSPKTQEGTTPSSIEHEWHS